LATNSFVSFCVASTTVGSAATLSTTYFCSFYFLEIAFASNFSLDVVDATTVITLSLALAASIFLFFCTTYSFFLGVFYLFLFFFYAAGTSSTDMK
jgi:hypothetical protein